MDSTTHNDLDSLNIPSVDMKTKYDIESTLERLDSKLDATYGLVNSANSCESGSGSKGSEEGVLDGMEGVEDSEGMGSVESMNSRLNEQSIRGGKSEGQATPESMQQNPGCTTDPVLDAGQASTAAVKTDLDASGKLDSDSNNRDVDASSGYASGSPPGIVIQKGPVNPQAGDSVSGYPSSTKCDPQEQSGCVSKLSPGSLNSPSSVCVSKGKIITNLSGGKPQHYTSEKEHLNGMIRQGPQNVTVCGPNRMDPRGFQGSGVYPPRQPHPRGMSPPFIGMSQGSPLSSGNNSPMSPHNTMSSPQVSDPTTGGQPAGYSSPPLQGNYPYNSAQYNHQMSSHPMTMPSMNGQGFPNQNMRGPHVQQGPRAYGPMPMGGNNFYPQGRPVRSPQGMPSFPQGAYVPQGYPPHGHPQQQHYNNQQAHTGYGNQYQMPQQSHKGMGTYTGNYQAANMHQYNGQNPQQFATMNMGGSPNSGGYPSQNFGAMSSVGSPMPSHTPGQVLRPGGPAGPAVQQGPAGAAGGGPSPVRMEGGFPGYHGNSLTHFPAGGREVSSSVPSEPSPTAGAPTGAPNIPAGEGVPHETTNTTASNIVNSQQLIQMSRRFGNNNINNNFVHPSHVNPNLQVQSQQVQSLPANQPHQQLQQGNRPPLGSQQQMYVNPQQGQPMSFNSQYTTYTNTSPQQNPTASTTSGHGNCDTTNNNSLSSNGNDGEDSIPEFSMFGDYAPQSEFY